MKPKIVTYIRVDCPWNMAYTLQPSFDGTLAQDPEIGMDLEDGNWVIVAGSTVQAERARRALLEDKRYQREASDTL